MPQRIQVSKEARLPELFRLSGGVKIGTVFVVTDMLTACLLGMELYAENELKIRIIDENRDSFHAELETVRYDHEDDKTDEDLSCIIDCTRKQLAQSGNIVYAEPEQGFKITGSATFRSPGTRSSGLYICQKCGSEYRLSETTQSTTFCSIRCGVTYEGQPRITAEIALRVSNDPTGIEELLGIEHVTRWQTCNLGKVDTELKN